MADFFTHFSCVLDVGTPDNAARALDLYQAFTEGAAREDVPPTASCCRFNRSTAARPCGSATR
jgi:hypothetical protein